VILFASPQTETTLGLRMSRFNVAAVRERIAKSHELFAKATARRLTPVVLESCSDTHLMTPPRFACGCPSLFSEEMRLFLERLQDLQGRIVSIGEPRCRRNVKMSESRGNTTTVGEDGN
jgi:hypothetical protein